MIYDQVLVINHHFEIDLVNISSDFSNLLILSTHHLFDKEKNDIKQSIPHKSIKFLKFDNWNKDIESQELDLLAYQENKKWINHTSIYQASYLKRIIFLKNKFIFDSLQVDNLVDSRTRFTVYCSSYDLHNLGVSHEFWESTNNSNIITTSRDSIAFRLVKQLSSPLAIKLLVYYLRAIYLSFTPRKMLKVSSDLNYYFYNTNRLTLINNLKRDTVWTIPFLINKKKSRLAAPIHSCSKMISCYPFIKRNSMVVVNDAFRPTSYPSYYSAMSYVQCKIVVRDKVDASFFSNAGLELVPFNTLLPKIPMPEISSNHTKKINTICLSLNHAGDWCSYISRCDTDGPIALFVNLALELKAIHFLIRLHPNSDKTMGEGKGWSKRIKENIDYINLPNLSVSSETLEKDWVRSDLFISEYSFSVVNALEYGKIALFLNTTNRVSFMQDLTKVGFKEVNSLKELLIEIKKISADPKLAYEQLAESSIEYNQVYLP
jgi:hypothetical protein